MELLVAFALGAVAGGAYVYVSKKKLQGEVRELRGELSEFIGVKPE